MAFGIVSITLVTVYFAYMNATTQNKELDQEYDKLYGAGAANYMRERKVNKWEWYLPYFCRSHSIQILIIFKNLSWFIY